jgi:energy-coupling factor transport system substrate-specific component
MNGPGRPTPAMPLRLGTGLVLVLASMVGVLAFGWPLLIDPDRGIAHGSDAPLVLALVLLSVLAVVSVALSDGGIDVKAIAVLGLLSAIGSVLRPLSAGTAGIELVFLVIVLGGRVFGPGFGFALGSTTLFTSALLTGGVGPWLPFQMLAASWVGIGAGLLPRRLRGRREVVVLATYAAAAGLGYGLAMDMSWWPFQLGAGTTLSFVAGDPLAANLHRFLLYSLSTSLGWDVGRAVTTALGVAVVGRPVLAVLRRAATRASFGPAAPCHTPGADSIREHTGDSSADIAPISPDTTYSGQPGYGHYN